VSRVGASELTSPKPRGEGGELSRASLVMVSADKAAPQRGHAVTPASSSAAHEGHGMWAARPAILIELSGILAGRPDARCEHR